MLRQLRFSAFLLIALCGLLPVMFVADGYYDDMTEARAERNAKK